MVEDVIEKVDYTPEEGSRQNLEEQKDTMSIGGSEELQRAFSVERRDIEDAFKMEIAELEDQHEQTLELLQQKFITEQVYII